MSKTVEERKAALGELSVFVKKDIKATMEALNGLPVTIRLLDPPLHEFVPHNADKLRRSPMRCSISVEDAKKRGEGLHETNPMLGHRGVRLGITYPEVSEMQVRAILEAAGELIKEGKKAFPEIMIPVTCAVTELNHQKDDRRRSVQPKSAKARPQEDSVHVRDHDRDPARGAPGQQDGRDAPSSSRSAPTTSPR